MASLQGWWKFRQIVNKMTKPESEVFSTALATFRIFLEV